MSDQDREKVKRPVERDKSRCLREVTYDMIPRMAVLKCPRIERSLRWTHNYRRRNDRTKMVILLMCQDSDLVECQDPQLSSANLAVVTVTVTSFLDQYR
eukprot:scaffold5085_cov175-Skeletonema_marinoi.AAC.6